MKFSIILSALLASACEPGHSGPAMDDDSIRERAVTIRICENGMRVQRDPVSGRLTYSNGLYGGVFAAGAKPEEVCK